MDSLNFIVPRKKTAYKKSLIVLLVAGFIIALSITSVWRSDSSYRIAILQLLSLLGVALLAFFVNTFFQLLKKSPALEFKNEGLVDNITYIKAGLIRWEEIKSAEIKKFNGGLHILIFLKDSTKLISPNLGRKRKMAEHIAEKTGTPLAINLMLIEFDAAEIVARISERTTDVNV